MKIEEIRERLTDLMTLWETINSHANELASKAAYMQPQNAERRAIMDRYHILLDALNIVQEQLIEAKRAAVRELPQSDAFVVDLLVKYGVAEPRQLNASLDPEESIQWADDRPWIASVIVDQVQAAIQREVR